MSRMSELDALINEKPQCTCITLEWGDVDVITSPVIRVTLYRVGTYDVQIDSTMRTHDGKTFRWHDTKSKTFDVRKHTASDMCRMHDGLSLFAVKRFIVELMNALEFMSMH